jgi:hypothetical protein
MTKEQAIAIARQLVAAKNQTAPLPAPYYWVVKEPVEYEQGWYFDHCFDHRQGQLAEEPLLLGGAPGFLLSKSTGSVTTLSWGELAELPEQDRRRRQATQQAAQQMEALLAGELSLARLRQQLKRPLPELQAFKAQLSAASVVQQQGLLSAALYQQALELTS